MHSPLPPTASIVPPKSRAGRKANLERPGNLERPANESADSQPDLLAQQKSRLPRILLFLTLACVGCWADLWSKQAVFAWRGLPDDQPVWWLWRGYVGIQTALNTGAVFGALSGWTVLFATLSVVALSCIIYWVFSAGPTAHLSQVVALACITAGILGNLYDRLGLWAPTDLATHLPRYAVRDWILLCYGGWTWPNFNLADSFLVCATAVLVWGSWQSPETASPTIETLD